MSTVVVHEGPSTNSHTFLDEVREMSPCCAKCRASSGSSHRDIMCTLCSPLSMGISEIQS